MNCKNLRIRSKNYKKYFYCTANKCVVDATTCYCCKMKEYKTTTPIKRTAIEKKTHKVSKMAKACDISQKVKYEVWERDNHQCIFCNINVPVSCANAHCLSRAHGGLGIVQNIVTACPKCHHELDNGKDRKKYTVLLLSYMKRLYGEDWNPGIFKYTKWKEIENG